jgi:hypothetical protein
MYALVGRIRSCRPGVTHPPPNPRASLGSIARCLRFSNDHPFTDGDHLKGILHYEFA